MAETWFTADTHFGHANIIWHCRRPFADWREMDAELLDRWNALVKPQDDVWHLGDFNFRSVHGTDYYARKLHGRLHIVWGNHDDAYARRYQDCFASSQDAKYLRLHGQQITLYHYAQRVWRNSHHGAWHLFGHSHGSLPNAARSMDVGVDAQGYAPVHFDQVRSYMDRQPVTFHHPREEEQAR